MTNEVASRGWRADRVALGVLLGGGALLAASRFNDLLGLTGDNAVYLLLARNLASGRPYDNAGFPWGYPALLTPIVALFGPDNLIAAVPWLKLLTVVALLLGLALLYRLFRLRHGPLPAAGAAALFAVNGITLVYTNDVMTELPYVAASAGALLFFYRKIQPPAEEGWSVDDERAMGLGWRLFLLAGLLLVLSYYLRTVGIALLAAAPLALLLRRRWRDGVLLGAILAAFSAPWAIFSLLTDPDRNYTASLLMRDPYQPALGKIADVPEFIGRLVDTAQLYATQIWPTMLLPGVDDPWRSLLGPLLLAMVLGGFLLRLFRRIEITEIYVAGFLFILLAWPWRGDRFLLPVLPFLLHYMMETAVWLWRVVTRVGSGQWAVGSVRQARSASPGASNFAFATTFASTSSPPAQAAQTGGTGAVYPFASRAPFAARRAPLVLAVLLVLLALPNLLADADAAALNFRYWGGDQAASGIEPEWLMYFDASRWVGQNTPPGSVILSRKSSLTELYAGRPSELIPLIPPEDFPAWLRDHNVTYIIEDNFTGSIHTTQHLRPALAMFPAKFKLLYSTAAPVNRVWQVLP